MPMEISFSGILVSIVLEYRMVLPCGEDTIFAAGPSMGMTLAPMARSVGARWQNVSWLMSKRVPFTLSVAAAGLHGDVAWVIGGGWNGFMLLGILESCGCEMSRDVNSLPSIRS